MTDTISYYDIYTAIFEALRSELALHIENSIKKIYSFSNISDEKTLLNNIINTFISICDYEIYEFNRMFTQCQVFIEYLNRFKIKYLSKIK